MNNKLVEEAPYHPGYEDVGFKNKMNNEPVAWMHPDGKFNKKETWFFNIPLYTHPVKEQDTDCQYCKQGCIRCDARKQLTDEQIFKLAEMLEIKMNHALYAFARTLIKNAQENLECYKKLSDASKMASKPISEKSRGILRKAQEK